MKDKIHKDFHKALRFSLPLNRLTMFWFNYALWLERKLAPLPKGVSLESIKIPSRDGRSIPVKVISPIKKEAKNDTAMIYYHGGAFLMHEISAHYWMAAKFATELGIKVYLPRYRLAIWHPYPAGFNDCYDVAVWLGRNFKGNIILAGDSAGAAAAAGVSMKALDTQEVKILAQCLIIPCLDDRCSTDSAKNLVNAPLLNSKNVKQIWEIYLRKVKGDVPEYAAPARRKNLKGLPPTYIENAEIDPLRDEADYFAKRLRSEGVYCYFHETKGTIHGYQVVAPNSKITQDAWKKRLSFLKDCMDE